MFKKTKDIVVCVNKKYNLDVQHIVDHHVKVVRGTINIYLRDDDVYVAFKTKMNAADVAKVIKEKLYKSDTTIVESIVFVKFN